MRKGSILPFIVLSAFLTGTAIAAKPHHHWRTRSHHRYHRVKAASIAMRASTADGIYWPVARYLQDRDRDWWTVSNWTSWQAVDVNHDNSANLDQFGTGKIASADLVRFTKPSMVVSSTEAGPHGMSGVVHTGWSSEDQLKEGQFIAAYQSMLLRSFQDEHK